MPLILKGLNQAGGQRDVNFTPDNQQVRTHRGHAVKVVLLGAALSGLANAASYRMTSFVVVGTQPRPAFAWCDARDRILAVTAPSPALSGPDDVRGVSLLRWLKNKPVASNFHYKLGPLEGAAGSTYIGLIPAGFRATRDLTSRYFVHLSNVESPAGMGYRMQRVVRFKTMQGENTCRYIPNAAFMGATAKRTVIVWDEGDAITYATRNFDGTPGVYVTGGRKTRSVEGGTTYDFRTEDGFQYRLVIDDDGPGTGAAVHVFRNGSLKSRESFLAYSISTPTP
ncbi:hypothetical protein [Deinococcus fonticola]|uniref:hypothetical protein n=1 Tax=Deinococcus fonticola TaxID=2528713 RepID=UPI001074AB94|nr:hypothetical protein [Deinococcus fonticola]